MIRMFAALLLLAPLLSACLAGAAIGVAGAAIGAAGAVVGTGVKTAGAVVDAVIPGDDEDEDEDEDDKD